jgi:general secretion pathway protein D
MIFTSLRRYKDIVLVLSLVLWSAPGALAQNGNRGGTGRGTTGRTGGGSGRTGSRDYPSNGMIGDALISSDPETRRVIVITDDETAANIEKVITNLDRPKPQVLIKVAFLEVTYKDGLDLGIEGQYQKNMGNSTTGSVSQLFGLAQQGTIANNPYTSQTGAGIYQILGSDFQVTLRAIQQADKLEVLSRPSILARNNQQASITVGQKVPLVTDVRYDSLGNQINSFKYTDVGIILRVTPFITSDGMVEMIISPEISALSGASLPVSSGSNGTVTAPIIDLRSADTVVVTPNHEPVIIGGLMANNKQRTDSKVPILGDIPLLGNLFKHKLRSDTKTELMIFLTPHIVMDPSQLIDLSRKEKSQTELAPKSFSEQELNRFLDSVPAKPPQPQQNPPPNK